MKLIFSIWRHGFTKLVMLLAVVMLTWFSPFVSRAVAWCFCCANGCSIKAPCFGTCNNWIGCSGCTCKKSAIGSSCVCK